MPTYSRPIPILILHLVDTSISQVSFPINLFVRVRDILNGSSQQQLESCFGFRNLAKALLQLHFYKKW